jgi:hypothetical protein
MTAPHRLKAGRLTLVSRSDHVLGFVGFRQDLLIEAMAGLTASVN